MPKPRIKEIKVDEKELEKLLLDNPESIEEGMKILGHQVPTDSGPLDILAIDSDGILTVIELKSEIDDKQLDQGVRYYDWARSNIEWISRSYSNKVDVNQEPRLILIAPSFSENLKKVAKYVDVSLDLMEYHVIQISDGEKDVLCTPIEIEMRPEPLVIPTKEEHLKHIENVSIKQLCEECLKQLEEKKIEVRPIENYWFSIWYGGKRFMYLGCKKRFFVCEIQRSDGTWTGRIRITNKTDWDKTFNEEIIPVYKSLGGSI
ncbi:MAG: endonuclease NucS domain-containing protein [Fervidobacterium sp.]